MIDTEIKKIIEFWFSVDVSKLWFYSSNEFDQQLKKEYEQTWRKAAEGQLDHWKESALGALALVIVLDQFPLNMFRGSGLRYSTEAKAREIAQYAIDNQLTAELEPQHLSFLYLPFMHSESLQDQQYSIDLYTAAGLDNNLKYAHHHYDVINRFGRFPHRNEELGRTSSEEELEFLSKDHW